MLRLGPGRVSGMAAGKPANGEGGGNGENHSGKWSYFRGWLAEVRIYNQALAAAAIKDHYTQGNSAVPGRSSSERK